MFYPGRDFCKNTTGYNLQVLLWYLSSMDIEEKRQSKFGFINTQKEDVEDIARDKVNLHLLFNLFLFFFFLKIYILF